MNFVAKIVINFDTMDTIMKIASEDFQDNFLLANTL